MIDEIPYLEVVLGLWSGFLDFSAAMKTILTSTSLEEWSWMFVLVLWIAFLLILTFLHMGWTMIGPATGTGKFWNLYKKATIPFTVGWMIVYLYMNWTGTWVTFNLIRQLLLGG